mgnify:CR=1 FL=1
MAQKRDMFDDIIDITKGLSGITEPFSDLTNAFLGNPEPEEREWNPADYKEKPRANALSCLACRSTKSSCRACVKICPVNAIEIEDAASTYSIPAVSAVYARRCARPSLSTA